jgi:hypothetical protein
VTTKNVVFWDIKSHFVLHRRHITCPLLRPASKCYGTFKIFSAVTMKNAVFCDCARCGSGKNDVSEERKTLVVRVTRTDELGTSLAGSSSRSTFTSYKSLTLTKKAVISRSYGAVSQINSPPDYSFFGAKTPARIYIRHGSRRHLFLQICMNDKHECFGQLLS